MHIPLSCKRRGCVRNHCEQPWFGQILIEMMPMLQRQETKIVPLMEVLMGIDDSLKTVLADLNERVEVAGDGKTPKLEVKD